MDSMTNPMFFEDYVDEIATDLSNDWGSDNHDDLRFGALPLGRKGIVRHLLAWRDCLPARSSALALRPFRMIAPYAGRFQWLYGRLADDESRRLLVRLLAYRALGFTKVRLPLSTPEYWQGLRHVERLADGSDCIRLQDGELCRTDLGSLDFPLSLYCTARGAYTQFVLQQYRCRHAAGAIQPEAGDYVIDGGACWGDTALYLAHRVGAEGRVFSFEFIPANLAILQRNLSLNPVLEERVTVVDRALWSESDRVVFFSDRGPGSRASLEEPPRPSGRTATLTIDDLVQRRPLPRVDFIKLDVEGAELLVLQGAAGTIERFRPKLAVSIYHRLVDFLDVPEFIAGLDVRYRFYIRHFTVHTEETVLFAVAESHGRMQDN
jgi:FkbM family methyltransferase